MDRISLPKTKRNPSEILVSFSIHLGLATALAALPVTSTYRERFQNKARSYNGLVATMRKWCDMAGLHLCSSHGLRKEICRRIVEANDTPHEIMAELWL